MLWMAPPPARECQGYGRRLRLPRFGLWRGHGYRANRPNTWPLRPPLHWYILAFAGSCLLASLYGFLQGAWPFGIVEAIWSGVAVYRWRSRTLSKSAGGY